MGKPREDAEMPPTPPETSQEAPTGPTFPIPAEPAKQQPVREATAETAIAAGLVLLLNKVGITEFTMEEGVVVITAIFALANEAARMKVWADYKRS